MRVASGEIVLTFSERLDAAAARAVQVTPAGDTPPEVQVRGRELRITLDSLREATTYVVTVSTDLRDARRVALPSPLTLAFATGDELDRGRIAGRVLSPETGAAASGVAVWAYAADSSAALPDPRQRPPDYQTETGADGAFALDYLRRGTFFVVAVQDRNRNRRADAGEPFALPSRPLATADTTEAEPLALYLTTLDSLAPAPQRARGLSDRRLAVRFSEPVVLAEAGPAPWALADSANGATVPIRAVYVDPVSPQEVRLEAARPLAAVPHRISLVAAGAVADSSGNAAAPFGLVATPSARDGHHPGPIRRVSPRRPRRARLGADAPHGRGARGPLLGAARLGAARVTRRRRQRRSPYAFTTRTTDGLVYRLDLAPDVRAFAVRVASGDSVRTRRYRRLEPRETGELVGTVVGADGAAVLVQALPSSGEPFRTEADASGRFRFAALPPGDYRLRFVLDRDGDGAWTGGRLAPFAPPEPLAFGAEPQTVRARFETDVGEVRLDASAAPPEAPAEAPEAE